MKAYYADDCVTIYHGDARELLSKLARANLILTDPPYGIKHKGGGGKSVRGQSSLRRHTETIYGDQDPFDPDFLFNQADRIIAWGANHYSNRLTVGTWHVWDKLAGVQLQDSFSDVEFAWDSKPGKSRIFHYLWKGVLQDGEKGQRRIHPTQKPLALMRWCLELAPEAMSVLDPFMGGGTTLRAAKDLGRKAIGIEIEERYCEIAAKRMDQSAMAFEYVG